ncbi:CU044_5270 family protein [Spirillospora sp. NPDC029432]|uniref:CU044_5270 family protein n=1 Tax=Spirillospora sp. NPDC029432 TaxID=3154599 RepID=UPI0034533B2C
MIDQTPPMPPARQDMPAGRHAARRTALMTEMSTRRRAPGHRLLFAGLGAAALAGGVAAALVAVPDAAPGTDPDGGPTMVVPMSAPQVLDRAAETAAREAEPRPGQYIYRAAESRGFDTPTVVREQSWYSVNGKGIGLKIEGGQRFWVCEAMARPAPAKAPADCGNDPAYRRDLPIDVKAMRAYLYQKAPGPMPPDVRAYSFVHEIVSGARLAPAAQAAMFKATGTLPGVKLVETTKKHIAVGQTWRGVREELLFEPGTYRFLGTRTVADPDRSFQPKGGKDVADPKDFSDPEARARASKEGRTARYGADQRPGTPLLSWMITDQRVVDAIPPEQLKKP